MTFRFLGLPSFIFSPTLEANTDKLTADETGYTSSEDDNSRSGHYQSIKHVPHKSPKVSAAHARSGVARSGGHMRSPQDTSDLSMPPGLHYTPGGWIVDIRHVKSELCLTMLNNRVGV